MIYPARILFRIAAITVALASATGCNGILGGIYDDAYDDIAVAPGADSVFGTLRTSASGHSTITVDATEYDRWIYLDFRAAKADTALVSAAEPQQWDIALHRYDAKTNSAQVIRTPYTTLDRLVASNRIPQGEWHSDTWTTDVVPVDMTHMLAGYLIYAETYCNLELSSWLDVDLSTMPPIYTPSNAVYVVRFADGTFMGIRLDNYMNAKRVKGYLTLEYIYPLTLPQE